MSDDTRSKAKPVFTEVRSDAFAGPNALAIAWADFDGDGYLEAAVGYENGELRLFRNDGRGNFTNIGPQMGFPASGPAAIRGLAWGDYNGSGFPSLYVGAAADGRYSAGGPAVTRNMLFHNNGGKSFTEMAEALGLDLPGATSRQVMWLDYDNSGRLGLFVAQRCATNILFRNDGNGFTNVTREAGMMSRKRSVGACFFDFHKSGWLDIFIGNQEGDRDTFLRNDEGKFVDIVRALGIDQSHRADTDGSPGCSVVDYDNDGNFDLFIAAYGENIFYRNDGNGRLVDVARKLGLDRRELQCGSTWADFDLDGRIDLYVTDYDPRNAPPSDHLYRNTPDGFVDVFPDAIAAAHRSNHSVQWVDYDNRGVPSLSIASAQPVREAPNSFSLYRNDIVLDGSRRGLSVRVLDAAGHSTQAGAEVRVFREDGTLLGAQIYNTTGGYDSQSDMPVLFGVPGQGTVDIEVTFMSRHGRIAKRLSGVDPAAYAGKAVEIRRDAGA